MDDYEIRAYLGQKNPDDDNPNSNQVSEMNVMRDQSGFNTGHSRWNREYTIIKKYTARWYWVTWNNIKESTTASELSSWNMPRHYDGSFSSVGGGSLNWKGQPICGHGGIGINCQDARSGVPNRSPNGGHGCKTNLGKGWGGQLSWRSHGGYDTYQYICEGAQHSSSNRFAHRQWIRSPDSQKDW